MRVTLPDELARILLEAEAGWNGLDFEQLAGLWDKDYPNLVYIPEERPALFGWEQIEAYYASVKTMMSEMEVRLEPQAFDILGDTAFIVCLGRWRGQNRHRDAPSGGSARACFWLRDVGGAWKLIQYVEAVLEEKYAPPEGRPG